MSLNLEYRCDICGARTQPKADEDTRGWYPPGWFAIDVDHDDADVLELHICGAQCLQGCGPVLAERVTQPQQQRPRRRSHHNPA